MLWWVTDKGESESPKKFAGSQLSAEMAACGAGKATAMG